MSQLIEAEKFFNEPPKEEEFKLGEEVFKLIEKHKEKLPKEFFKMFSNNQCIADTVGRNSNAQLFLFKLFWSYYLLEVQAKQGVDTSEDRLLLNQIEDPEKWFNYFKNNTLEIIIEHENFLVEAEKIRSAEIEAVT